MTRYRIVWHNHYSKTICRLQQNSCKHYDVYNAYINLYINNDYISIMSHFFYIGIMSIICLLRNYALSLLIGVIGSSWLLGMNFTWNVFQKILTWYCQQTFNIMKEEYKNTLNTTKAEFKRSDLFGQTHHLFAGHDWKSLSKQKGDIVNLNLSCYVGLVDLPTMCRRWIGENVRRLFGEVSPSLSYWTEIAYKTCPH